MLASHWCLCGQGVGGILHCGTKDMPFGSFHLFLFLSLPTSLPLEVERRRDLGGKKGQGEKGSVSGTRSSSLFILPSAFSCGLIASHTSPRWEENLASLSGKCR